MPLDEVEGAGAPPAAADLRLLWLVTGSRLLPCSSARPWPGRGHCRITPAASSSNQDGSAPWF
jgi:hypothetical protein